MPKVEIMKESGKIIVKGENLYIAQERLKTRSLFFDLEIKLS